MSTVYLSTGHLDSASIALEQIVKRFPNSQRLSAAHFRLGELAFAGDDFSKAYGHFKKVRKPEAIDLDSAFVASNIRMPNVKKFTFWEMANYRLGECAYKTGDFKNAVIYFRGYIEKCDAGEYVKKEFREAALEYLRLAEQQR